MDPAQGFTLFFLFTLVALGAAAYTGRLALRKAHITLVATTALLLAVTIYYAKMLGEVYDLEAAGWITPVHLTIAKVATVGLVLPIVTGLMTIRNPERFPWHQRLAWLVILIILVAAVTGTWMILAAEPL